MGYLTLQDYYNKRIQKTQLDQITGNRDAVRLSCELEAQAEIISYLIQKYDVNQEFTNTNVWKSQNVYYADNRFILDATAYSISNIYAVNDLTAYQGSVYRCINAIPESQSFVPANWSYIGLQYDLYYLDKPYPAYNSKTSYNLGDFIYFNNKVYKCLVDNVGVLPNDINYGLKYWGLGQAYTNKGVHLYYTAANFDDWNGWTTYSVDNIVQVNGVIYQSFKLNNNSNPETGASWYPIKWVKGDNRSQQLIGVMLDLCLSKIHILIAPNNVPQIRKDNADYAIEWLRSAGGREDAITADIPLLQPNVGLRIRYGSNVKNINTY